MDWTCTAGFGAYNKSSPVVRVSKHENYNGISNECNWKIYISNIRYPMIVT